MRGTILCGLIQLEYELVRNGKLRLLMAYM